MGKGLLWMFAVVRQFLVFEAGIVVVGLEIVVVGLEIVVVVLEIVEFAVWSPGQLLAVICFERQPLKEKELIISISRLSFSLFGYSLILSPS
jgi:hypothetical protein